MESLALRDWRPAEFLVVAQLDITAEALQAQSPALLRDRPRGDEADDDLWRRVPHRRLPWWLWRHRLPGTAAYWLWRRWIT